MLRTRPELDKLQWVKVTKSGSDSVDVDALSTDCICQQWDQGQAQKRKCLSRLAAITAELARAGDWPALRLTMWSGQEPVGSGTQ